MVTPRSCAARAISPAKVPGGGGASIPEAEGAKGLPPAGSEACAPGTIPPAAWNAAITGLIPGQPGTRHALQCAFACCVLHLGHIHAHFSHDADLMLLGFTLQTFSASPDVKPPV